MKAACVLKSSMASVYELAAMILPQLYEALSHNPPDYVISL